MSQGAGPGWAGLGRAGRIWETPCLFWERFRMQRFWNAKPACHTVAALRRRNGLVPNALGSVGKVKPSLASLEPGLLVGLGAHGLQRGMEPSGQDL